MNEKDKFALVRKPSSAVEKVAPGAKRILSGMVADALALRNKRSVKRAFLVAICGHNGGLDEYLVSYLQKELTDNCAVQSNCFTDSEELLNAAGRKPFDLFFVFLNPDLPSKIGEPDVQKFIADLKAKFHRPIIIISNEYTYHRQMSSSFLEAGADAFFPMPFDLEHLGLALTACGIFSSSLEPPAQLIRTRPIRIVIVNDELFINQAFDLIIRRWFKDAGVLLFDNGDMALKELSQSDPDLLITDDTMPVMSGEELCRNLLARKVTYPIIVDSAWEPTEHWVREFAKRGLNVSFLPVPCDMESLLKAVETALKIPRNTQPMEAVSAK